MQPQLVLIKQGQLPGQFSSDQQLYLISKYNLRALIENLPPYILYLNTDSSPEATVSGGICAPSINIMQINCQTCDQMQYHDTSKYATHQEEEQETTMHRQKQNKDACLDVNIDTNTQNIRCMILITNNSSFLFYIQFKN